MLVLSVSFAKAQEPDSSLLVFPDSIMVVQRDSMAPASKQRFVKRFWSKDYPNPRRAALLAFVLPGAGQVYNKKWWKVPIVYVGLGTVLYFEIDNIRQYRALRDNYKWLVDDDPDTNPTEPPYNRLDANSLRNYRDQWRRYVEINSILLGVAYLMQVTDAYVDAHLHSFDVSENLSLRFRPKMETTYGLGATFGAGVSLQFGRSRPQKSPTHQFSFSSP